MPSGQSSERKDGPGRGNGQTVYRVLGGDPQALVGWAVPAETMGFADKIRMIIGLSADGEHDHRAVHLWIRVKRQGWETKSRTEAFARISPINPPNVTLEVVKPGQTAEHPIDAITGATISSKAVTQGINQRLARSAKPWPTFRPIPSRAKTKAEFKMLKTAELPGPTERFLQGVLPENPVFRQLLGMCPDAGSDQYAQGLADHGPGHDVCAGQLATSWSRYSGTTCSLTCGSWSTRSPSPPL